MSETVKRFENQNSEQVEIKDPYFGLGLKLYNHIQILLAKRFGGGNKKKETIWFERYQNEIGGSSGKFRGLLEVRPDLVELIKADQQTAILKIEEELANI